MGRSNETDTVGPELGDKVQDIVTEFEGIVTGRAVYLWGCVQVCVHFRDQDNKPQVDWFDIQRVKIVERAAVRPVVHGGAELRAVSGPDIPAPTR